MEKPIGSFFVKFLKDTGNLSIYPQFSQRNLWNFSLYQAAFFQKATILWDSFFSLPVI